jgi:hypothetical protein
MQPEHREPSVELPGNLYLGLPGDEAKRAAHYVDEWQKSSRCPVGRAATIEVECAILSQPATELVQQARFSHARISDDVDHA